MTNYISVFDILKIGVGPSSSHTLGPWKAAIDFISGLEEQNMINQIDQIMVQLFGSLALTGIGHGTDIAVVLGLTKNDPETVPISIVKELPQQIKTSQILELQNGHKVHFEWDKHIEFYKGEQLTGHPNGLRFLAFNKGELIRQQAYYSVGGGFIQKDGEKKIDRTKAYNVPYPISKAEDIERYCHLTKKSIAGIVRKNEESIFGKDFVTDRLQRIAKEMIECIYRGCHTDGILPGGLNVHRKAPDIYRELIGKNVQQDKANDWLVDLQSFHPDFIETLRWISCFAMAVNEENADFSRVVTAPTNGAAGVIPAVLAYFIAFSELKPNAKDIEDFLLTAAAIGALYKNGATISAAMGGCQAEIGVSSSMAAVALTEALGGSIEQALEAGEVAMEHHLGLTCDPIKGLVQIPCIERNSMGAIKAITASQIALSTDVSEAKVSLDGIIQTMWETAQDMNAKYKETSLGGMATNISVIVPEC